MRAPVVENPLAKTYVNLNAAMDRVNRKHYFGRHFTLAIRDSLTDDEQRALLERPGVLFVRE